MSMQQSFQASRVRKSHRLLPFSFQSKTVWAGAAVIACLLQAGIALNAQTSQILEGRVINGTSKRPVAKAEVKYVMMAQGPSALATQVTDAEGKFRFDKMPPATTPVLLRVEYQGATYSRPVIPQQPAGPLEIQVFDAAHDRGLISVKEHAIFLHPSGKALMVMEQIILDNHSTPQKTYMDPSGTFPFSLPGEPQQPVRVAVEGPGGMPINQAAIGKGGKNSFAIAYPIRPGETQIRLEYSVDYKAPFTFAKSFDMPAERVHIVTPGNNQVQIAGEGLKPVGADPSTGFMGYQVAPKGNSVRLEISGDVPMDAPGGDSQGEEAGPASLVPIPDPVTNRRWIIVSVAGLVMLAGLVYHLRHG